MRFGAVVPALWIGVACSSVEESEAPLEPAFPASYAESYVEVRNCRKSGDHDLAFVRVLADSNAAAPYLDRATEFPAGAVVIKEEYDFADATCSGEVNNWTVMRKLSSTTSGLGWDWQRVSSGRTVIEAGSVMRCQNCHAACSGPPGVGYDYTCTDP